MTSIPVIWMSTRTRITRRRAGWMTPSLAALIAEAREVTAEQARAAEQAARLGRPPAWPGR
jgi:hypothetical protein